MAVVASMPGGIRCVRERRMRALLARTAALAAEHLDAIGDRHAGPIAGFDELRASLGGPLPEAGVPPERVGGELARGAPPRPVASPGPRYFRFVTGGALPAGRAAARAPPAPGP